MNDAIHAMNGFDEEMGGGMPPKVEEHIYFATLSKDNKVFKFEGCDDAESTLILRRATLDAECEDSSRHVIQVISLDHADNRTVGTLCSLKIDGACTVALDGISVAPPTAFKLLKGDGPLTICGNLMKEVDQDLLPDDEDELEEIDSEEVMEDDSEEEQPEITQAQVNAKVNSLKAADDKRRAKRKPAANDDSSTDSETEVSCETPAKKAKSLSEDSGVAANGDAKKPPTPKKEKKPKAEGEKKEPRAKITSAEELIVAVKSYKGGLPKRQGKFENWVKNTLKCDNKEWAKQAWTANQTK